MRDAERCRTAGGVQVERLPGTGVPIVLAHGMFASRRSMRRLASYLNEGGRDVWTFDFRGHGESDRSGRRESFEAVCLSDVDAVVREVLERSGSETLSWVGHSGGGLAVLMYLARRPERRENVFRAVCLASQATEACRTRGNRLRVLGILAVSRCAARLPGAPFGVGEGYETSAVMRQWARWNLAGEWLGEDGFDYLGALGGIETPVLTLAGGGDRFIAPPSGCHRLHDALGGRSTRALVCGVETGFSRDYGHGEILGSRGARSEVWPLVKSWAEGTDPTLARTG